MNCKPLAYDVVTQPLGLGHHIKEVHSSNPIVLIEIGDPNKALIVSLLHGEDENPPV